ncbi:lspA [Wigglesworthia glossinidia endosymbiont of Glossina brevipalpis]|uniref:Lipoprotein signal peptidase n=1 Tax=Wigglesworthia glossinidia brevipalpis TaxID=36870 RepID=LSPA_WIGBR|nr:RecName: Full=Lipoprotein signal peptidase; AltName: Full=Prolipoprotein signal peptidase; AltName: Full=Signal peptidase II; Short=SPase II [Wigglesworthia glossinidia endosymbiont of Glossina brevipalpis]BAC24439.1 lspA [Wigglesworthia glossinidia endosymbiont of Glossina brevipalpis]
MKTKSNLIIISIFLIDFFTKKWILNNYEIFDSIKIFPMIKITYIRNYGIALGLFQSYSNLIRILIIVISIFILLFIFYMKNLCKDLLSNLGYSIIIGGSFGNIFDRIFYGSVIDFIDIYIYKWHFPVFNFADISIFIGFLILIYNKKIFIVNT